MGVTKHELMQRFFSNKEGIRKKLLKYSPDILSSLLSKTEDSDTITYFANNRNARNKAAIQHIDTGESLDMWPKILTKKKKLIEKVDKTVVRDALTYSKTSKVSPAEVYTSLTKLYNKYSDSQVIDPYLKKITIKTPTKYIAEKRFAYDCFFKYKDPELQFYSLDGAALPHSLSQDLVRAIGNTDLNQLTKTELLSIKESIKITRPNDLISLFQTVQFGLNKSGTIALFNRSELFDLENITLLFIICNSPDELFATPENLLPHLEHVSSHKMLTNLKTWYEKLDTDQLRSLSNLRNFKTLLTVCEDPTELVDASGNLLPHLEHVSSHNMLTNLKTWYSELDEAKFSELFQLKNFNTLLHISKSADELFDTYEDLLPHLEHISSHKMLTNLKTWHSELYKTTFSALSELENFSTLLQVCESADELFATYEDLLPHLEHVSSHNMLTNLKTWYSELDEAKFSELFQLKNFNTLLHISKSADELFDTYEDLLPHLEHISDEDSLQKVVKYHQLLSNLPTDYKIEDILLLQDRDLHPLSTSADLETALKENEALIKIRNMTHLGNIRIGFKPSEENFEKFRKNNKGVIHTSFIPQPPITKKPANIARIEAWFNGLPQFIKKSTEDLEAEDAQNSAASLDPSYNDDVVSNSGNFYFTNSDISLPDTSL